MKPTPAKLEQIDARHLGIEWSDGLRRAYAVRELRLRCPCAHCVSELTGERILDPATVPDDVHPAGIEAIGLYALRVTWSDGHETGLYTYESLHAMGEEWPAGTA